MRVLSSGHRWRCLHQLAVRDHKTIDLSLDHNLEEFVDTLTKEMGAFTNDKSSLQENEILPGIGKSNHEIVFAENDI